MGIFFKLLRAFIDISIMVGVIVGSSLSVLGLLGFLSPKFDILNQFQLLFLALTLISFAASFVWPYFFPRLKHIAQVILFVPLVSSLVFIGPEFMRYLQGPELNIHSVAISDAKPLRVMSFNIFLQNWDRKGTAQSILAEKPDVVLLQEYAPNRFKKQADLKKAYPYQARCKNWRTCTLAILSQYPLADIKSRVIYKHDKRDPVHGKLLSATIKIKGYPPLRVHSFHSAWPAPLGVQQQQFSHLAKIMKSEGKRYRHMLLGGDFNSSGWSVELNKLGERMGLNRHTFLLPTYPSPHLVVKRISLPESFLSLDHIFTSTSIPAFNAQRVSASVADHRPVVADILLPKSR